jgi:signal transduction histidine kinase
VNNALKHGHAKRIEITIEDRDGLLILAVIDDGNGLPADHTFHGMTDAGMGLRIMSYRASMMGGSLKVTPGAGGRGAIVTCIVPGSK